MKRILGTARRLGKLQRVLIALVAAGAMLTPAIHTGDAFAATKKTVKKTTKKTVKKAVVAPFTLSLSQIQGVVEQGRDTRLSIEVTRSAGFTGPISLGMSALPAGLKAYVGQQPMTGDSTTLRLVADANAVLGDSSVRIVGSNAGRTASEYLSLLVSPPSALTAAPPTTTAPAAPSASVTTIAAPVTTKPAPPTTRGEIDYSISLASASVGVPLGSSYADVAIKILRTGGFAEPLFLEAKDLPQGMGVSFLQNPVTGSDTVARFTASQSVLTPVNVTIFSRGRSARIAVSTTTATSGSTSVNLTGAQQRLVVSPATLNVAPGSTGAIAMNLDSSVQVSGPTNWQVAGLPFASSGGFLQNGVTSGSNLFNISTTSASPLGTYTLTFTVQVGAATYYGTSSLTIGSGTTGVSGATTVSPSAINVNPGGSGSVTFTPSGLNATLPIAYSFAGLPNGVTPVLTIGSGNVSVQVNVAAGTPSGVYQITISGTQNGQTASGSFSLNIGGVTATTIGTNTSFVLSANPTSTSVARGGTAVISILTSWTTTASPITFSASGGPGGLLFSYTVNPSSVGTTLNVSIPAGALTGSYQIAVTGAVGSVGSSSISIPLTIT